MNQISNMYINEIELLAQAWLLMCLIAATEVWKHDRKSHLSPNPCHTMNTLYVWDPLPDVHRIRSRGWIQQLLLSERSQLLADLPKPQVLYPDQYIIGIIRHIIHRLGMQNRLRNQITISTSTVLMIAKHTDSVLEGMNQADQTRSEGV